MAAILTNGVLKIRTAPIFQPLLARRATRTLHKGSRCTPANAAHSPPRPQHRLELDAGPDGQAHSQPTDQPPSPPTRAGAASSQQSPPACRRQREVLPGFSWVLRYRLILLAR